MKALAKPAIFVVSLIPAALLVWAGVNGRLGVNPAETLQGETGIWALRFLLVTLAITPLRRLSGWNRFIQYRRMLGLFAFFYAFVHLMTYVVLDRYFDFAGIAADVAKRPFISAGMGAFILMLPLALTSTKASIRRLGRRWQLLHRLVYLCAVAAVVHYLWKVKVIAGSPVYYAGALLVLLGLRLAIAVRAKSLRAQQVNP